MDYNAGFQGALAGVIWAELGRESAKKDLEKLNKSVSWYEGLTYWHGTKLLKKNPSLKDRKVDFSKAVTMQKTSLFLLFVSVLVYFSL